MDDIHDIVPAYEILPFWIEYMPYLIFLASIFIILACLYGIEKYKEYVAELERQRRRKLTPYDIALKELESAKKLISEGNDKELALSLSNSIRYYMENEFHMHAPEKTTEEFLYMLEHEETGLFLKTVNSIKEFSILTDLAKYAKQSLTSQQRKNLHELACEFIEQTHTFKPKLTQPTQEIAS